MYLQSEVVGGGEKVSRDVPLKLSNPDPVYDNISHFRYPDYDMNLKKKKTC